VHASQQPNSTVPTPLSWQNGCSLDQRLFPPTSLAIPLRFPGWIELPEPAMASGAEEKENTSVLFSLSFYTGARWANYSNSPAQLVFSQGLWTAPQPNWTSCHSPLAFSQPSKPSSSPTCFSIHCYSALTVLLSLWASTWLVPRTVSKSAAALLCFIWVLSFLMWRFMWIG
jgi:hypothetical protein